MRRRDAQPDPEVDHGLRELEAALAGEPAADPDLTLLVADVRAVRPEPDPQWLAALDARVHDGFAPPVAAPKTSRRTPPWHVRLRRPEILAPAVIALCAALVVVLVTTNQGNQTMMSSSGGSASTMAAQPESAASGAASSTSKDLAMSAGGTSSSSSSSSSSRAVERSADLTLTPSSDDVQDTADGVVRATQTAGGYVQESSISTRGTGHASFTLRIPTARLDATLASLSKLAHVGALEQASTDITAQTASAAGRLADARAERRALLRALGKATTARQIASLRARIRDNRAEIAGRQAQLNSERRRAQLATVTVQVDGKHAAAAGGDDQGDGGSWTPGDALHDAGRILEVSGGVALIALAVLAPLAVLAALAALGARGIRRRRREGALDSAR